MIRQDPSSPLSVPEVMLPQSGQAELEVQSTGTAVSHDIDYRRSIANSQPVTTPENAPAPARQPINCA
jgi:hypothetical protein